MPWHTSPNCSHIEDMYRFQYTLSKSNYMFVIDLATPYSKITTSKNLHVLPGAARADWSVRTWHSQFNVPMCPLGRYSDACLWICRQNFAMRCSVSRAHVKEPKLILHHCLGIRISISYLFSARYIHTLRSYVFNAQYAELAITFRS